MNKFQVEQFLVWPERKKLRMLYLLMYNLHCNKKHTKNGRKFGNLIIDTVLWTSKIYENILKIKYTRIWIPETLRLEQKNNKIANIFSFSTLF